MEPPGVPKETLQGAKTMRAELLIQTNKKPIIKCVKVCHNINLTLDTTVSSTWNIHVCLHLQHAATLDISNIVRCINPNTDVLEQLNMYIHEEIEQLSDYIQQCLKLILNKRGTCYTYNSPFLTIQFKKHGGNQIAIYKNVAHSTYTYMCYILVHWPGCIQSSQCHNTCP